MNTCPYCKQDTAFNHEWGCPANKNIDISALLDELDHYKQEVERLQKENTNYRSAFQTLQMKRGKSRIFGTNASMIIVDDPLGKEAGDK